MSGQATTCPGGHWHGRGPDNPAGYPYDVFKVDSQASNLTSGDLYDQTFVVRLAGYCPIGLSGVDANAVQQLFCSAFLTSTAQTALLALSLRNNDDKVLGARLSDVKGEYAQSLRDGRDVFLCGMTVEIIVQGTRGTV